MDKQFFSLIDSQIKLVFNGRPKTLVVWDFLQENPSFVIEIKEDIDKSIQLFNQYRNSNNFRNEHLLKSSSYLKQIIIDDLPHIDNIIQKIKTPPDNLHLMNNILNIMNRFEFIEKLEPMEKCAGTLLIGAYRSAILAIYPYIKQKNGQVASSLEEMTALMAIDDHKTKLFECIKDWFDDYEEEGFTKELSVLVKNIN